MKKTLFISSMLLTLGLFNACEDDNNTPVAAPGAYEQEALQDANLKIDLRDAATPLVLTEEQLEEKINMIGITEKPEYAADTKVSYKLYVSRNNDLSGKQELKSELKNDLLEVSLSDLNELVKNMFGKKPQANELYARLIATVVDGTTVVAISSDIAGPIVVTPVASVIESGYYLIGDINKWNPDELLAFKHSGADVYDDPIFTFVGEFPDNCYFKFVPQSSVDRYKGGEEFWSTPVFGTAKNGDTSLEGVIAVAEAQAVRFETGGFKKVILNMEEYTYTLEELEMGPNLYVPGNHQGWAPQSAPMMYSAKMDMKYKGWLFLDGEFKFTSHPDWDHKNYGNAGGGKLTDDSNAGNLKAETPGFYYLFVDLGEMSYEMLEQTWGIVGSATAGGWDANTDMVYDRATNQWSITTDLAEGEFKFRANNNWDYNFGGTPEALVEGGDNIKVEAGNYTIVLTLSYGSENKCSIKKN